MTLSVWLHFFESVPASTRERITQALAHARIALTGADERASAHGLAVLTEVGDTALAQLRLLSSQATVLAIAAGPTPPSADSWALLAAGAADVLCWPEGSIQVEQVTARLARWDAVRQLADTPKIRSTLVGSSEGFGAPWCVAWSRSAHSPIRRC